MPISARDQIKRRNDDLIEDFYERGFSHAALVQKYGLSSAGVRKILKCDQLANGERERATPTAAAAPLGERRKLSAVHALIGTRVASYMEKHGLNPTLMGDKLQLSSHRITALSLGVYELSLSDVLRISTVIGVQPTDLLTPSMMDISNGSGHVS